MRLRVSARLAGEIVPETFFERKENEMRRIMIIATFVAFAQAMGGFSPAPSQTPRTATTLRRIQVNTKTITALPRGKKYVVDLTQRGVKYEFDPSAGQIDFSRVMIRTARGEFAISSFLERKLLKDKLAGFKYAAQSFSLGSPPAGTPQRTPTKNPIIVCKPDTCTCIGADDCDDMIYDLGACGDVHFCATNPLTGEFVCTCIRKSAA